MKTESKIECTECGNEADYDDGVGEGKTFRCYDCYRESLTDCQLCSEGVEEDQVSPYILVKTEFAESGNRLPGIYRIKRKPFMTLPLIGSGWLHGDDVLFIDQLPEWDSYYEISGNICHACAKKHNYPNSDRKAYGRTTDTGVLYQRERQRVQAVVAEHPEMLRDLETDMGDEDLQEWCPLPVFAPTFHPRLFLEYKGVRIYGVCGNYANWLSMRPEPSFRNTSCLPPGIVFAPGSLATWKDITLRPERQKDQNGQYYDTGYRYGNEWDYRQAAKEACMRAIDRGLITPGHAPEDAR